MKNYYPLLFLFIAFTYTDAAATHYLTGKGYIITLNGKRLTGSIGGVFHSTQLSEVVFINDFGTPYNIRAELIQGFVFKEGRGFVAFESKFDRKRWLFLKVLAKGEGMSLYKTPPLRTQFERSNGFLETRTYQIVEYWVELDGKPAFLLKKRVFKRRFSQLLKRRAPELAAKIGTKGYKYKDMLRIAQEYNEEYKTTEFKT